MASPSSPWTTKKRRRLSAVGWLRDHRIREFIDDHRRLVEVQYSGLLSSTVHALAFNNIFAVPVWAPAGAPFNFTVGRSRVLESVGDTNFSRKRYIGIITMLDILVEIYGGDPAGVIDQENFYSKMASPVYSVLGNTLEDHSLWPLNANTSILDCMKLFSKGVQWAMVAFAESQGLVGIAIKQFSFSSTYRMITQMDLLSFLCSNSYQLTDIMTLTVGELEVVDRDVFAVTEDTKVRDVIRSTMSFSRSVVPVIAADSSTVDSARRVVFQPGRGKRLLGTFSATYLQTCSILRLQWMLNLSVAEVMAAAAAEESTVERESLKVVSCHYETTVKEVMAEAASARVHLVWVVDREGLLTGFVSVNGLLGAMRKKALEMEHEQPDVVVTQQFFT